MRRVTTGVLHGVSTVGFIAHVLGGESQKWTIIILFCVWNLP